MNQPRGRFSILFVAAWVLLLFLFLPSFVAVPMSLTPHDYLSIPTDHISLRHYADLLFGDDWIRSIGQSLVIAFVSSMLATAMGSLAVIGIWSLSPKFAELIRGFLVVPLIVPPIISALAFYRLLIDIDLIDSYPGTILAHTILALPFVVLCVTGAISNLDPRLEHAARSLGATLFQSVALVIVPAIWPGILTGALFAFVASWDELVVTLFITSFEIYTLPRRIWEGLRWDVDPVIAAVATLMLTLTVTAIVLHLAVRWRQDRKATAAAADEGA